MRPPPGSRAGVGQHQLAECCLVYGERLLRTELAGRISKTSRVAPQLRSFPTRPPWGATRPTEPFPPTLRKVCLTSTPAVAFAQIPGIRRRLGERVNQR